VPDAPAYFNPIGIGLGEEPVVEAYFGGDGMGRRDPVNGGLTGDNRKVRGEETLDARQWYQELTQGFTGGVPPSQVMRAEYSRLVGDVERFENDEDVIPLHPVLRLYFPQYCLRPQLIQIIRPVLHH
jgi:hypothetical protein